MDETPFYHALAIAAQGNYHVMKRYRTIAPSWNEVYSNLAKEGVPLPDPEREFERLDGLGIQLVMASHREYPDRLRHIPHPPFGIYIRGAIAALAPNPLTLAIVGTRRASADGKRATHHFARELAAAGFTIASGLAFGIDAAAHEGCLDADGITIAALAGGLDNVYPYAHKTLAQKILAQGGALISEYPPGEAPFGYRFVERNRIISGISRGVLIVEAPEASGAIATARYAVEQNRDVFVMPGAVTATNFKGSHALIRQGAELVTSPNEILEAYDVIKKERTETHARGASPEEILILKALEEIGTHADVDKLATMTKLEPRIVNRTLSFLILRGIVKESDGGYTI
jgi:DNA processing protein